MTPLFSPSYPHPALYSNLSLPHSLSLSLSLYLFLYLSGGDISTTLSIYSDSGVDLKSKILPGPKQVSVRGMLQTHFE
jgi:hypothetical protein